MASSAEAKKTSGQSTRIIIIVGAIIIAALAAAVVFLLTQRPQTELQDGAIPKIGYAAEARTYLDEDSLNAAMAEAMRNAADGRVGLRYKNDAYSGDGLVFDCFIANSSNNIYDMFLTIFADAELADQIYLSGLIPPGSAIESVTLDHELEPGDHTVYVALTQVDTNEETGEQVIKNQVMHTMEFHVDPSK